METITTLNVTEIEPRFRHPIIFEQFDALEAGEGFVISIDHDPKPLYYQLIAERGNIFSWEYLAGGPDNWRVKIERTAPHEQEATIGEIVAKDYRKAQVFKKFGIDFCCGGKKTVTEVCDKKGIDISEVKQQLASMEADQGNPSQNYQNWELDFLCDYIVSTHHKYVKDTLPFLSEISAKVARVHGDSHPEVVVAANAFAGVAADLSAHLLKEEKVLFPYIKQLVAAKRENAALPQAPFGQVSNPIQMMEAEHEHAGEDMSEIRTVTNDFAVPDDACTSYRILFKMFQEFESDLHQHIHLENNILFPKAIDLERTWND